MNHHHWSDWKSPVGLGFFLLTASIAFLVALMALTNLLGTIMALSAQSHAAAMPMQYETQGAGAPVMGQ